MSTSKKKDPVREFLNYLDQTAQIPPDELELSDRSEIVKLLLRLAPRHVNTGRFRFLKREIQRLLDEGHRTVDKKGRRRSKNQTVRAHEIELYAACGIASACLRTATPFRPKMVKDKAQKKVSQWTEGRVGTETISKWTPQFGAVKSIGRDAKKHDPAVKGMASFFSPEMSETGLKRRVKTAFTDYKRVEAEEEAAIQEPTSDQK